MLEELQAIHALPAPLLNVALGEGERGRRVEVDHRWIHIRIILEHMFDYQHRLGT